MFPAALLTRNMSRQLFQLAWGRFSCLPSANTRFLMVTLTGLVRARSTLPTWLRSSKSMDSFFHYFFCVKYILEESVLLWTCEKRLNSGDKNKQNKLNNLISPSSLHKITNNNKVSDYKLCHSKTSLPNCTHWWDLGNLEWARSWISQPNKTIHCLQTLASPSQVSEFAHQQCNKELLHWQKQTKFQVETVSSSYHPTTH